MSHRYHISYAIKSSTSSAVTNFGSFQYATNLPYLTEESINYIENRSVEVAREKLKSRDGLFTVITGIAYMGESTDEQYLSTGE